MGKPGDWNPHVGKPGGWCPEDGGTGSWNHPIGRLGGQNLQAGRPGSWNPNLTNSGLEPYQTPGCNNGEECSYPSASNCEEILNIHLAGAEESWTDATCYGVMS